MLGSTVSLRPRSVAGATARFSGTYLKSANLQAHKLLMMSMHCDSMLHNVRPIPLSRRPRRLERIYQRLRCRSYFRGKEFTTDWTSEHFAVWHRVLIPLRNEPIRILEIGSWEGRSATWFLNFFKRSTIVCIDTFAGNTEEQTYKKLSRELPAVESRFDRNLAQFGARIEKIKSQSALALERLKEQERRFELVYIDGSHRRDDVMVDSLGGWRLLAPGGIVIWDDYTYAMHLPPEERPQPAIDAFLAEHHGHFRLLAKTKQVIVERLD
jgi:predicted O-methyltransferase YrrM